MKDSVFFQEENIKSLVFDVSEADVRHNIVLLVTGGWSFEQSRQSYECQIIFEKLWKWATFVFFMI